MRDIERQITIRQIDQAWVQHLTDMEYLREGIGLRGYGQVDPLVAYKKEALELFGQMQAGIQGDVVRNLFLAQIQYEEPQMDMAQLMENQPDLYQLMQSLTQSNFADGEEVAYEDGEYEEGEGPVEFAEDGPVTLQDVGQSALLAAAAASAQKQEIPKVGPNDPCPCGSGLKYKNCHRNK
jgi:preprotein translocase subunit SecA